MRGPVAIPGGCLRVVPRFEEHRGIDSHKVCPATSASEPVSFPPAPCPMTMTFRFWTQPGVRRRTDWPGTPTWR